MDTQEKKSLRLHQLVYVFFSLVVTVGVFSYLFTQVTLAEVVDLFREADIRGVLMFVVLSIATSILRLMRYALVLRASGYAPNSWSLFLVVLVRNFFADLLPARLGSLIYIYLTTGRLGVPFGPAASSFALAFIFDMIAMAPLIALAAIWAGVAAGIPTGPLLIGGAVIMILTVVVLVILPACIRLGARILNFLRWPSEARRKKWRIALLDAEHDIIKANKSGIYLRLLFLSMLVRFCKYGALYVFLFALVVPLGYGFAELSVPKVFIGLVSAEFSASLPISGIAGFGAYEGTWAFIFRLLGFPAAFADITAIAHHLFTQLYGYLLGVLGVLILLLPAFRKKKLDEPRELSLDSPLVFYWRVTMIMVITVILTWLCYSLPAGPVS